MSEQDRRNFQRRVLGPDGESRVQRPPKAKIIAEHTVAAGETLSDIALKYYGSAVKEKWMVIYDANKAVIGNDPGKIRPGQVLKIPELSK